MAKRILFFEADAGFAADVAEQLRQRGAEVEVTDDGNAGVDRAAQLKPDLILLTIELPQMNGFLVCKKLKKSPDTSSIPIVILSSEATEDIFEQHKKLRTRAESYLRKPIDVATLMAEVTAIVPLDEPVEAIAISEVDVSFDESPGTDLHAVHAPKLVDPDVAAFADNAFDQLMLGDDEATTIGQLPPELAQKLAAAKAPPPPAPKPPPPPAAASASESNLPAGDDTRTSALEANVRELEELLTGAESKIKDSEQTAERAKSDVERLERELAEAKRATAAAAAAGGSSVRPGAPTSRELLDLREALNRKDKELLDLKDQVGARDKQLFDLRDKSFQIEREQADLQDRIIEIDGQLAEAKQANTTLASDKESAGKRAEDLKGRLERAEAKTKKVEDDFVTDKATHAAALEALRAEIAAATAVADAVRREHDEAVIALRAEQAETLEGALKSNEDALTSLRTELEGDKVGALAALRTTSDDARESALAALRAALEAEKGEAVEAARGDLRTVLTTELNSEREVALEALRGGLAAEHEAALGALRGSLAEEHETSLGALRATLAEDNETSLGALRGSLAEEHETSLGALRATLAEEHGTSLGALRATLAEEHETHLNAVRTSLAQEHETALGALRTTLEAAAVTVAEESNRKHGSELATLGRKIAETENQLLSAAEKFSEKESEAVELQKELESTQASLASTRQELEGVQAELARTKGDLEGRISGLTSEGELLRGQLAKVRGKIAGDDQILERARKALAISLSLLDDRNNNGSA